MRRLFALALILFLLLSGCGKAEPVDSTPVTTLEATASSAAEALALCERAAAAVEAEEYEGAELAFRDALALDETLAGAWLGLADVYVRTGDFAAAEDILSRAEECVNDVRVEEKLTELKYGRATDSSGRQRQLASFDTEGNLLWYHYMTYYPDGRLHTTTAYDREGNQLSFVENLYNEAGLCTQWCNTDWENGKLLLVKTTFDDRNRSVAEHHYWDDSGEELEVYYIREYDEQGNHLSTSVYSADGSLMGKDTTEYDAQGRAVKSTEYESDGSIAVWYELFYDAWGYQVKLCEYDAEGSLRRTLLSERNEQHQLISQCDYDSSGALTNKTVYEYDTDGNCILTIVYDGEGNETARYAG